MDSPSASPRRRPPRRFLRRCERGCWLFISHLPLAIVYSLTTWAVYVEVDLCRAWAKTSPTMGSLFLFLGVFFYCLLNWSYTVAAFTDPGSPLASRSSRSTNSSSHTYTELPLHEQDTDPALSSITVKSTGGTRFCKKCQAKKPDRAHHCSTCRRCVLKMDHHCPWLATCVGFHNYKAFILFCTYVTLFCYTCFGVSGAFLYDEFSRLDPKHSSLGINMILLAIIAFMFGLVMTGFTGWHLHLAVKNMTTIECLEKTRYLGTLQKQLREAARNKFHGESPAAEESQGLMQKYSHHVVDPIANSIPGVTRPEEGESRSPSTHAFSGPHSQSYAQPTTHASQARDAQHSSFTPQDFAEAERDRERERYEEYLDERDSEQLPNAFDLGWRRNLALLFGPAPLLYLLPICNSAGDGFAWPANPAWARARELLRQKRELAWKEQEARERRAGWGARARYPVQAEESTAFKAMVNGAGEEVGKRYLTTNRGVAAVPDRGRRSRGKADKILGRSGGGYADGSGRGGGGDFGGADADFGRDFVAMQDMRSGRAADEAADTASLDGLYDGGDGDGDEESARTRENGWNDWD